MRQKEIKYFGDIQQGRLNADDSPFALTTNEWLNSENIRTGTTDNGFTGIVESVGGNAPLVGGDQLESVQIGAQTWSARNLNTAFYKNGDPIPEVTDPTEWENLTTGAWCYYDNDPANGDIYGKLYNWYAVTDPRGLAPEGWRIPTLADYQGLEYTLGQGVTPPIHAGGQLKEVGTEHWLDPNSHATDRVGFTALGAGGRFFGDFAGSLKYEADFWTLDEDPLYNDHAYQVYLAHYSGSMFYYTWYKDGGMSVRLIEDKRYITIGTTEDTENRRLVYFNYDTNPEREDKILCAYTDTKVVYEVLKSSQVFGGLNFSLDSLIHSAKITDGLLSWVDSTNNQPRKINLESAIAGNAVSFVTDATPYVFPLNFSEITMIKPPPIYCPNIQKLVNPTYINNFIETHSFEFAFQYQYYDSETTVIGSYSIASRLGIDGSASNYIQIDMDGNEQIPQTVQRVNLIVRTTDGTSGGGNNAFIVKTWDKSNPDQSSEIDDQNNGITVLTYNFYNDITGNVIAPDDVLRPYDSVPIYSQTHEVARSRYFLGNNVTGYDTPTKSSLTVLPYNAGAIGSVQTFQLYKITIQSTNTVTATKQWAFRGYLIFDGHDYYLDKQAGHYAYTIGSNTLPAMPTQTTSPINANSALVKVGYQIFTIVNKLIPRTSNNTVIITPTPTVDGTSYCDVKTIELIKPVFFIQVQNLDRNGYTVFAQQSPYKFGVVFYDYAMRKCGVVQNVSNDELTEIFEYSSVSGTPSTISSLAPNIIYTGLAALNIVNIGDTLEISNTSGFLDGTYTVTSLRRGIGGNTGGYVGFGVSPGVATVTPTITDVVIKVFRQLTTELTTPTATGGTNGLGAGYINNIRWEVSSLNRLTEIPDWAYYYTVVRTLNLRTRYFVQSYTTAARYMKKLPDGLWDETSPISTGIPQNCGAIALPIDNLLRNGLGYTYEEGDICILSAGSTGGVINVNLPVLATVGKYILVSPLDLGDSAYGTGIDRMPINFEIYHPYKTVEQEPYYEVGEIYDVLNPGTEDRDYSSLNGNLRGDCSIITRYIAVSTSNATFTSIAMCANDLYFQRWDNDGGKINVITQYGRTNNSFQVAYSDAIISGTKINGTSTFRTNNVSYVPSDCGIISKLQLTSKIQNEGTVMLGLCAVETTSMYLGEQQITDNTGGTKLFSSVSNVIGTINTLKGGYGCDNPESVTQYRGRVYWVDTHNGRVVQYSENGLDAISNLKMNRFWKNWCAKYLSMSKNEIASLDNSSPSCTVTFYSMGLTGDEITLSDNATNPIATYTQQSGDDLISVAVNMAAAINAAGNGYTAEVVLDGNGDPTNEIVVTAPSIYAGILNGTFIDVYWARGLGSSTEYSGGIVSYTNRPYLFAIVDPYHDELLISMPKLSNIPPQGFLPDYTQTAYPFDILDYQAKTISYKLGSMAIVIPHWQSPYTFTTEYFGAVQNKLFSFKNGIIYEHNQAIQNNFYGQQFTSKIMFTSNMLPQMPKVYDNFLSESNLIPNFVYFYNNSPYIQTSDLDQLSFVNLEGIWYASILRNKIVPTLTGYDTDGLLTAEVMRNKTMYVLTEYAPVESPLQLNILQIAFSISKGHNI